MWLQLKPGRTGSTESKIGSVFYFGKSHRKGGSRALLVFDAQFQFARQPIGRDLTSISFELIALQGIIEQPLPCWVIRRIAVQGAQAQTVEFGLIRAKAQGKLCWRNACVQVFKCKIEVFCGSKSTAKSFTHIVTGVGHQVFKIVAGMVELFRKNISCRFSTGRNFIGQVIPIIDLIQIPQGWSTTRHNGQKIGSRI